MGEEYNEIDLLSLPPLGSIRLRPRMYLLGGTTKNGLHDLLDMVVTLAISQAKEGNCKTIAIHLSDNGQVIVQDDGLGMPVEKSEQTGEFITELSLTKSFIPGIKPYFSPYFPSINSVGIEVANAVSAEFHVKIKREGYLWGQSYKEGVPQTEFRQIRPLEPDEATGSTVTFRPDFTIFEPNEFDFDYIANRMNQVAYCVPELSITVSDERSNHEKQSHTFHHPSGVAEFIQHLNRDYEPLHDSIVFSKEIQIPGIGLYAGELQDVIVDVAIQYVNASHPAIFSYINSQYFSARSLHENELLKVIEDILGLPIPWINVDAESSFSKTEDVLAGLTAVVSVWHSYPEFESNRFFKLISPEPATLIREGLPEVFETFHETQPEQYQRIIDHIQSQMQQRENRRRLI